MQAVIAILAALVQRAADRRGRVPRRVGRRRRGRARCRLYVDEYFATGEVPGPRHNILTGRYACYDVYRCADDRLDRGRRDRAALLREPVPRARLRAVARAPDRRRGAGRDPRRLPRRDRDPDARRVGRASSARPTRACRRSRRCPSSCTTRTSAPATCSSTRARPSTARSNRSVGCSRAWIAPNPVPCRARRDRHRHRRAVAGSRLLGRGDRGPTRRRSRGVSERREAGIRRAASGPSGPGVAPRAGT